MPGFDGTGPLGMGPRTGGGFGFCYPFLPTRARRLSSWFTGFGVGRGGFPWGGGRGRAFGGGRGWWWKSAIANYFPQALSWWQTAGVEAGKVSKMEKAFLEDELTYLHDQIKEINARLEEIKNEEEKEKEKE